MYENIYLIEFFQSQECKYRKMSYFRYSILAFFAILPILSYLHFWEIVFFECVTFLHEKMRHFIIVIEKYTKNDDNQNINGFTKVHEKYTYARRLLIFFPCNVILFGT